MTFYDADPKQSTMSRRGLVRPGLLERLLVVAAFVVGFLLIVAAPALAHVDLESSTPADGTSVSAAPEVIELVFTSEAIPAGEGVVLASADGTTIAAAVTQPEPQVIHVVPDESLVNGVYGVLWTMRAGDAHPRSGTFTFQVDAPVPPLQETLTPPGGGVGSSGASDAPSPEETGSVEPGTEDGEVEVLPEADPGGSGLIEQQADTEVALQPVFEVSAAGSASGEWIARIGRWIAMTGTLVGIGALVFAATSLIGTRREVEESGYWIRRSGVLILVGTVVEVVGASAVSAESIVGGLAPAALTDVLAGSFGLAVLLRAAGGAAMLYGTAIVASESSMPVADGSRLPAAGRSRAGVAVVERTATTYRLDVHQARFAVLGIGLVTASYLFDGHTVTTSPAALVRAASAVHVLAAGVWVGGVLLMAWTLSSRYRRGAHLDAAPMVIRFSRVASAALALVAVAGGALALAIVDAPTDLFTTAWGRVLIVKLVAVAIAASIGAYNHFVTVPALEAEPADGDAANWLRQLVRIEGGILLVVVAVTAVLVGAAS